MRVTFYTPTQRSWSASENVEDRRSVSPDRPAYITLLGVFGRMWFPPYRCRLGLNYLHQNLACNILIQLCLYTVYTEGLDRLLEHDLLLRYVQTILLVQLLSDFLGGNSAEQAAARAALGRNLYRALLELLGCLAGCLLLECDLACMCLILRLLDVQVIRGCRLCQTRGIRKLRP